MLNRRNVSLVLVFGVLLAGSRPAPAQTLEQELNTLLYARKFGRVPKNKSEDWTYVISIARAGERAWTIQKTATGDLAKRAFSVRSTLFAYAAQEVVRWQRLYLEPQPNDTTGELRYEGRYVHTSFIVGLYLEYAADYWQALKWFQFAENQISAMRTGEAIPVYNKTPLDQAIYNEIASVNAIISQHGSTPPYQFQMNVLLSASDGMLAESRVAAKYALNNGDPKLLAGPEQAIDALEP